MSLHLGAGWGFYSVEEFVDPVHAPKPLLLETRYLLPQLVSAHTHPSSPSQPSVWPPERHCAILAGLCIMFQDLLAVQKAVTCSFQMTPLRQRSSCASHRPHQLASSESIVTAPDSAVDAICSNEKIIVNLHTGSILPKRHRPVRNVNSLHQHFPHSESGKLGDQCHTIACMAGAGRSQPRLIRTALVRTA